jgi:hypothetical protein
MSANVAITVVQDIAAAAHTQANVAAAACNDAAAARAVAAVIGSLCTVYDGHSPSKARKGNPVTVAGRQRAALLCVESCWLVAHGNLLLLGLLLALLLARVLMLCGRLLLNVQAVHTV